MIIECLHHWALLELRLGRPARSAWLFGVVRALGDALRLRQSDADTRETDAALAGLRDTLGESEFEREWAAGQALTIEEAIDFALQEVPEVDRVDPPGVKSS